MADLETELMAMDIGPLFGLWFQSMFKTGTLAKSIFNAH
jgi:hypothetical protein